MGSGDKAGKTSFILPCKMEGWTVYKLFAPKCLLFRLNIMICNDLDQLAGAKWKTELKSTTNITHVLQMARTGFLATKWFQVL